ncbi:glycosyltransferase family 2 protein [Mucilaginibacter mali]|uniref:Glycosyltransferase family 2 protein n=1 Tax=Mucilaginibacter mali TaxID=2740462 RepID=A0A7D4QKN2_9SPHI|nr:glycosyltransferase family A protein [Mucilaginibacter mali]QKJ30630.1 glycosyltransferase family 2 protein [Mucilaginibacter mali]
MQPKFPRVSIIMAVYNRDFSMVRRALDSVMAQDFRDFELIVVDDGSDAALGRDILDYVTLHEEQLTYLRHKNIGQAFSINKGMLNSAGAYIGFIDSDDEYKPNHISACLENMKEYDLIASTTENIATCPEDLLVPCKDNPTGYIFIDECIVFGTLFGKREVFEHVPFRNLLALDPDFYERAGKKYLTQKLNLRTYKYYMGLPDSNMTREKRLRQGLVSI